MALCYESHIYQHLTSFLSQKKAFGTVTCIIHVSNFLKNSCIICNSRCLTSPGWAVQQWIMQLDA